ncbi:MAG: suppressor of fused domain protein [Gemmataceae bacterium]|nr:suppressor of fused domain protein [Gemmataceae bacterium]
MNPAETKHRELTIPRVKAFVELFDGKPVAVYPYTRFSSDPDKEAFPIDVFVFELEGPDGPVAVAVTNGLSDRRMVNPDDPDEWARRELIQYFRDCTEGHARRLHDMAWVPLFDGFLIDSHHSMAWEHPAVEGTPWKNALFVEPIIGSHREFTFEVEGDPVSLLWHIPISDAEREFKRANGTDALLDRMTEVELPWVFDEANRPSLVGSHFFQILVYFSRLALYTTAIFLTHNATLPASRPLDQNGRLYIFFISFSQGTYHGSTLCPHPTRVHAD